jgi:hypothetical protein
MIPLDLPRNRRGPLHNRCGIGTPHFENNSHTYHKNFNKGLI